MPTATVRPQKRLVQPWVRPVSRLEQNKKKAIQAKTEETATWLVNGLIDGHRIYGIRLCNSSGVSRSIYYADYTTEQVRVLYNPTTCDVNKMLQAGAMSWHDFQLFLMERCAPDRSGMDDYIRLIDLCEFDPISLIDETHGDSPEDDCYLTISDLTGSVS